jgi:hypothetical protein
MTIKLVESDRKVVDLEDGREVRSNALKLVGVIAASVVWLAPPASAAPIAPGVDLFETDPGATSFAFRDEFTIPPGFFDTGSAPFQGNVQFGGVPIQIFQGRDVGDTDTIVRRPQAANLNPPFPAKDSIPIQLVVLSLQSVQPIQVMVGTAMQPWDVQAQLSPTRPSQGQMTITKSSNRGGTFDSQLVVLPIFTFTRLSDGATRTLDVGRLPSSSTLFFRDLVLQSTSIPWRAGCVVPALSVPGLNDGFCPGLTIGGQKQVNVEESRLARHGVRPAQPRLEHFKCYAVQPHGKFAQRSVKLTDQFGATQARVVKSATLCAPVQKNRERLTNRTAQLKCYAIRGSSFQARNVAVRNQFGGDVLRVLKPVSLCVPSLRTRVRNPKPTTAKQRATLTDHFQCYAVQSQAPFAARSADLSDQFGSEKVSVRKPVTLCAPVQKNKTRVQHPVRHLVCYAIRDPKKFSARVVRVVNQFGAEIVSVVRPSTLCVPSVKVLLQ